MATVENCENKNCVVVGIIDNPIVSDDLYPGGFVVSQFANVWKFSNKFCGFIEEDVEFYALFFGLIMFDPIFKNLDPVGLSLR